MKRIKFKPESQEEVDHRFGLIFGALTTHNASCVRAHVLAVKLYTDDFSNKLGIAERLKNMLLMLHSEIVEEFLLEGFKITSFTSYPGNPLDLPVKQGRADLVRLFLREGHREFYAPKGRNIDSRNACLLEKSISYSQSAEIFEILLKQGHPIFEGVLNQIVTYTAYPRWR